MKEPKLSESDVYIGFLIVNILTSRCFFRSRKFEKKVNVSRIARPEHLYRVSDGGSSDAKRVFSDRESF